MKLDKDDIQAIAEAVAGKVFKYLFWAFIGGVITIGILRWLVKAF